MIKFTFKTIALNLVVLSFLVGLLVSAAALDFEEADGDYASVATTLYTDTTFTIMAWVNTEDIARGAQGQCVVSNGGTGTVGHNLCSVVNDASENFGGIFHGAAWLASGVDPTSGTWQHFAVTRRGGTTFLYIDGVEQSGTETTAPVTPQASWLGIGKGSPDTGTSSYHDGLIGLVKIYNRAFTAAEIRNEMDCYMPCYTDSLVGFYGVDENVGTDLRDATQVSTLVLAFTATPVWVDGPRVTPGQ